VVSTGRAELLPEPLRRRHPEERPQLDGVLLEVVAGEGPAGAAPGAEEVHGHGEAASPRLLEEQRRPALLGGAVGQRRHLQLWVDGLLHPHELAGLLEAVEELPERSVGHGERAGSLLRSPACFNVR
jgi:hypothetical protein